MTRRMLRSYERQLDNLGMKFSRNADLILDKMGGKLAAGGFDRAVKTVYLRRGATRYQAYHELQHALHFNSIGAKAYAGMGTFAREMHVFRQIWKNRGEFTRLEVRDAIRYGKDLRLLRKLGRID